jgi:hypothetical protein
MMPIITVPIIDPLDHSGSEISRHRACGGLDGWGDRDKTTDHKCHQEN